MHLKTYKELIVWQKSIDLVKEIYHLTATFPKSEIFGLTSQMQRCAISIPSNIAEGYGRKSAKEYAQFYAIAYGSALELETQLIIAYELKYTDRNTSDKLNSLLTEIIKMLFTMKNKIRLLYAKPY